MQTRRDFLKASVLASTALLVSDATASTPSHEAGLTTAQMRRGGALAKLTVLPLRNSLSLISGSGGNVLVLTGHEGLVIVDSGFATSKLHMTEAIRSVSNQPFKLLINTHWHFDHTDGNEWMHDAGATIVAYSRTRARMQHRQSIPEFEGIFPPSPAGALPTVTFDREKTIDINGHKINLALYTPAHTDTDTSVFFSDADVLHTGDACFSELYPFIDYNTGGSIDGMIAACRENLALAGPSTMVICGHGKVAGRREILALQEMLVEVRGRIAKLKQSGASSQEVIARKPTASHDQQWGGGFITPALFTWLVYRGI